MTRKKKALIGTGIVVVLGAIAYANFGFRRNTATAVTIDHGPVPRLKWPAMRMTFRVSAPGSVRGYRAGDRVRFTFDQTGQGPTLRTLRREPAR